MQLEQAANIQFSPVPADRGGAHSHSSSNSQIIPSQVSDDLLCRIRQTLQSDILSFISPALDDQKQVNEYCELRLNALAEDIRKANMISAGNVSEENAAMEALNR